MGASHYLPPTFTQNKGAYNLGDYTSTGVETAEYIYIYSKISRGLAVLQWKARIGLVLPQVVYLHCVDTFTFIIVQNVLVHDLSKVMMDKHLLDSLCFHWVHYGVDGLETQTRTGQVLFTAVLC